MTALFRPRARRTQESGRSSRWVRPAPLVKSEDRLGWSHGRFTDARYTRCDPIGFEMCIHHIMHNERVVSSARFLGNKGRGPSQDRDLNYSSKAKGCDSPIAVVTFELILNP